MFPTENPICRESGGGGNRTRVRGRTGESVYKLVLRFAFARRPVRRRPTDGLAILWSPASGDWLSLGGEPVGWRRIPSHGPKTERRRYLTRLGGECEIVLRTCFVPGCFTRPTGDLGLQLFRRTDHVET
jgi:hypothetical protein